MKLFVQSYNDKFIENICSVINPTARIESSIINKDIYKIHHQQQYSHYIFVEPIIDHEIASFIAEYCDQTKIFVYHSNGINLKLIDNTSSSIMHLSTETNEKTIKIPLMSNPVQTVKTPTQRDNSICAFLDNCRVLPDDLVNHLYPKSLLPIRLYNHASLKHVQNLGFLTESEKIAILYQSEFCIIMNNKDYILESISCGCKPIYPSELGKLADSSYVLAEAIQESTYPEFMEKVILI